MQFFGSKFGQFHFYYYICSELFENCKKNWTVFFMISVILLLIIFNINFLIILSEATVEQSCYIEETYLL